MNNKKKAASVLAIAAIVSMVLVTRPTYAAGPGFFGGSFFSGFIDFIAKEFNLDKSKV